MSAALDAARRELREAVAEARASLLRPREAAPADRSSAPDEDEVSTWL